MEHHILAKLCMQISRKLDADEREMHPDRNPAFDYLKDPADGTTDIAVFMNGLHPDFAVSPQDPDNPVDPLTKSAIVIRLSDATWSETFDEEPAPETVTVDLTMYLPGTGCELDTGDPPPDILDMLLPFLAALQKANLEYTTTGTVGLFQIRQTGKRPPRRPYLSPDTSILSQ